MAIDPHCCRHGNVKTANGGWFNDWFWLWSSACAGTEEDCEQGTVHSKIKNILITFLLNLVLLISLDSFGAS